MKRIALLTALLAAATATGVLAKRNPDEFADLRQRVTQALDRAADGAAANPAPAALGLGTLLLTVALHRKRKPAAAAEPAAADGAEPLVLQRAKARAARTQLVADQIGLENRQRKLPEAVRSAERELCYAEKSLADATRNLAAAETLHAEAETKLEGLLDEKANADAETAAIAAELKKLAELV